MQPFQYDLRCLAAKDNGITHAAAAPSNLDAAITTRFAQTELQDTIEPRATASEIAAPKPDLDAKEKLGLGWRKLSFLGHVPAILGLSCAKLGVCWAYLAAIGTSTAWATHRHFSLYKVKFDMTHFVG